MNIANVKAPRLGIKWGTQTEYDDEGDEYHQEAQQAERANLGHGADLAQSKHNDGSQGRPCRTTRGAEDLVPCGCIRYLDMAVTTAETYCVFLDIKR